MSSDFLDITPPEEKALSEHSDTPEQVVLTLENIPISRETGLMADL